MCSAPSVIIIVWHASTLIFLFRPIAFYHLQNQNNSKYFFFYNFVSQYLIKTYIFILLTREEGKLEWKKYQLNPLCFIRLI